MTASDTDLTVKDRERIKIESLTPNDEGKTVLFRARINTSRAQGSKMVFLNLRQRMVSIQGLIVVAPEKVSKQMAKWAASLLPESIVLVEGAHHQHFRHAGRLARIQARCKRLPRRSKAPPSRTSRL